LNPSAQKQLIHHHPAEMHVIPKPNGPNICKEHHRRADLCHEMNAQKVSATSATMTIVAVMGSMTFS
jgi:hypothetical protein